MATRNEQLVNYIASAATRVIPLEINDAAQGPEIAAKIDALFENSGEETLTESEQAFSAGFISLIGDLSVLINGIGLAVCFTILLVTANTMSMAVRERRREIAVLKTVGFGSGQVMGRRSRCARDSARLR